MNTHISAEVLIALLIIIIGTLLIGVITTESKLKKIADRCRVLETYFIYKFTYVDMVAYLLRIFAHQLEMAAKDHVAMYKNEAVNHTALYNNTLVLVMVYLKPELPHIERIYGVGFVEREFKTFIQRSILEGILDRLITKYTSN